MADITDIMRRLIQTSGNEMASIVSEGTAGDITDYIDTGCYRLNAQMSGSIYKGCPQNRIVGFGGDSQTLKSIISRLVLKKFLEKYPEDGIGYVYESEGASGKKDFEELGCDCSRIVFAPVSTVEAWKNEMTKVLNELNKMPVGKAPHVLFILDSYGNLVTDKTIEDALTDNNKTDMTKQKIAKQAFGIVSNKLMKHKYTLLVPNHTYSVIGSYFPQTVYTGGKIYVYLMTLLFEQTAAKIYNKDKEVIGNKITFKTFKSRLTRANIKSELLVHYSKGIYKYSGLLDDCIASGIWLKFDDTVVADPVMIEQYKIMQDIEQLEKYLKGKTFSFSDSALYVLPICVEQGWFGQYVNDDGETVYVVEKPLVEALPQYKKYQNEPSKREKIEKELGKLNIRIEDFVTKSFTASEIEDQYKTVFAVEQVDSKKIVEILKSRLAEYKDKLQPKIDVDVIKKTGTTVKAIEMNASKYFNKDVLDKLDKYLATVFCYGSELEARKAELKMEEELSKSKEE